VNTCRTTGQALLATALIQVKSRYGGFEQLRALIDSGSQSTIISEESAQILKQKRLFNSLRSSPKLFWKLESWK